MRNEALQNSLVGRCVLGRSLAGLLVERPAVLWLRQAWPNGTVPKECRNMGLGISKLGSQYQHCAACGRRLCVYAEGWGRQILPARSFVPWEAFLWTLPLMDALLEKVIISPLCALGVLQIAVPFLSASELFACLLSSSSAILSRFYPRDAKWPLKLQALIPAGYKNSKNSAFLIFQANVFGEMFSVCVPFCAPFSLTLPQYHSSLPSAVPMIHFYPKPWLWNSYPFGCGFFFPFCCGVCSVNLQVNFQGIYGDLIVI